MSGGKVDVLAVMDSLLLTCLAAGEIYRGDQDEQEARNAIAAVAELIETMAAMNALAKGPAGGVSADDKRAVIARADAALDAVRS